MLNVLGLGNPGEEYKKNRHNTGRIILEMIAKKDFSDWKKDLKFSALSSKGEIDGEKMFFVLPETFMNNSGKSVKPLVKSKKDLEKIVVIYDDLDLPLGRIKLSFNRSSGGHNGVESIIKSLKSEAFLRIRVGISPSTPSGKTKKPTGDKVVRDFLLKDFREKEINELKKVAKIVKNALFTISDGSKEKAMSVFN